ncbi:MAG: sigma-70 family RNA polymerase sigma factor [Chitinophagales bacterium]|nr:sigma-70 family RNA polymerase sigma factor [Chitinophagales bacterium]
MSTSNSLLQEQQIISDQEILIAFNDASKKEKAFTWLLHRDQKKIYWFIRRMVIDHDDANDLVQEVFIKVWKSLAGFRGESKITTWLYRIASNLTITFLEQKKKKFSHIELSEGDDLKEKLYSGTYCDGNKIQMKLQEAILTLPNTQRLIFQLRYYDELKYEEISEITGTTVGGLKANYHIAAKKVEAFIKETD